MRTWKQLPRDAVRVTAPRTLVEIFGKQRVLVEHHKGILGYDVSEIIVGATFGMIQIQGQQLRLCCMSREQVFIAGQIRSVTLEGQE